MIALRTMRRINAEHIGKSALSRDIITNTTKEHIPKQKAGLERAERIYSC
jgi:hypothetical protein